MAGHVLGKILSPILSLTSIILVILVIIAGSHPHLLTDWYFLKTQVNDFSIPSRLSNSTFLKDLSQITGSDWIGKDASKSSLLLEDSYTVGLLAACGETDDSQKCSSASVGFHFNPLTDLKLQTTPLANSFPSGLVSALSSYKSVSGFLGGAYIASAAIIFLATIVAIFATRRPVIAVISAGTAFVASLLLLAASITAPIIFSRLSHNLNSAFQPSGISTNFGTTPIIISWIATFLALGASMVLAFRARSNSGTKRSKGGVSKLQLSTRDIQPVKGPATASRRTPFSAVLQRIPTFGAARYTQVERQPQVVAVGADRSRRNSAEDDRELLFQADGIRGEVIHDDREDEEDIQGYAHGGPSGIAMQPMQGRATRDINLAYEPFSRGT